MKLLRLATIRLRLPAPSELAKWSYESSQGLRVDTMALRVPREIGLDEPEADGGPTITWPYEETVTDVGVAVEVDAGPPVVTESGQIAVSIEARRRAEAAILEYADVLAVTYQCRRDLRSPVPCVAVRPDNDDEAAVLKQATGLAAPFLTRPRPRLLPPLGPGSPAIAHLSDRIDGLALLADALSEDNAAGRVRDFFRLFERAFARGPGETGKLLAKFLRGAPPQLEYTPAEVDDWFALRPLVSHADRRDDYARSPDVEPHIGRIEFAAYDVLFNKETWRKAETGRRTGVELRGGIDRSGAAFMRDRRVTIVASWLDPFGSFPVDFRAGITMPEPWYSSMPGYTSDDPDKFTTDIPMVTPNGTRYVSKLEVWMRDTQVGDAPSDEGTNQEKSQQQTADIPRA